MTQAVKLAQLGSPGISTGFKNRIINGAMMIDQRNAGASITANNGAFPVDRFRMDCTQTSKGTIQQTPSATETGYSTRIAAGFTNYVAFTSSSAYSVLSTDEFTFTQNIEGQNLSDLAWGTANAKTVTLSFWVRSSLTGTFGGSFENNAANRSYPFTYTISSANTWEQKTITVAGDTSGTWLTTNGIGLRIFWSLGTGSNYNGTANAWAAGDYRSVSGSTSVVGTNGATWYITGVQLEVGTTATDFEYRDYGRELMMCQRYYWQINGSTGYASVGSGYVSGATAGRFCMKFPVRMRASPTISYAGTILFGGPGAAPAITSFASVYGGLEGSMLDIGASGGGLTTGQGVVVYTDPSSSANYVQASAEL